MGAGSRVGWRCHTGRQLRSSWVTERLGAWPMPGSGGCCRPRRHPLYM